MTDMTEFGDEVTRCLQIRVDTFKQAISALNAMPADSEDFVDLIDGFETSTESFKSDHSLIAAYWYIRGAAEALGLTLSELLDGWDLTT
jgi:hypothetical protein